MGSNPILSANGTRINPVFMRVFHSYIAKVSSIYIGEQSRCKLHILLPNGISAFLNWQKMRVHQKADSAKAKLPYFLPYAERLMLRYYEYLFRIKNFLYGKYSMEVLENLDQFPLDTNNELTEYYTKIATVVDRYNAPVRGGFRYDRFYVQKIKPFFVNNKIYYEVAFIPANDNASKTDSIIAFTDMEITSYYAVKFAIADNSIEIFDQRMPIRVIVDWEVNIRPCELKNFSRIVDNSSRDYGSAEQRNISLFLTKTGLSLSEVIMFSDEAFAKLRNQIVPATKAIHFFDRLEKCRDIIKRNSPGSNILRYLLHHLTNRVLRKARVI